jgi:hypothetical protein
MLTHIVVWKYRDDVEQFAREEHVNLLRRLRHIIPEVQSLSVGFDMLFLPRSYDTGLVAIFADRAALDAYTVHRLNHALKEVHSLNRLSTAATLADPVRIPSL